MRDTVHKEHTYAGYSFSVPTLGSAGIALTPAPYTVTQLHFQSQIIADLHSVWDIRQFRHARHPIKVGETPDQHVFNRPVIRILDMPIKLAGSNDYRLPRELIPFLRTIQMIIDHEHSVLTGDQLLAYNAYLTIDQSDVKAGVIQRKPGAHVDGFQGARIYPKTIINHSYIVSNGAPTIFYPQPFDCSHVDERVHDCFLEMDAQSDESRAMQVEPNTVYLMDAYTVHRAAIATHHFFRTFLRISYDVKPFDRLGNAINPLFSYAWEMVPREAQSTLIQYKALENNEKELIIAADIEAIEYYLTELKKLDSVHYYNFCYIGLLSENIDVVKLILKNLLMDENPAIQLLRLLFVAATQKNTQAAHFGKLALIDYFPRVKQHSKRNVFLDFVLEIITQKPLLLSREIARTLIDGDEHTPQGREILKLIKFRPVNSSGFWKTQRTDGAIDDVKPRQLMSKL